MASFLETNYRVSLYTIMEASARSGVRTGPGHCHGPLRPSHDKESPCLCAVPFRAQLPLPVSTERLLHHPRGCSVQQTLDKVGERHLSWLVALGIVLQRVGCRLSLWRFEREKVSLVTILISLIVTRTSVVLWLVTWNLSHQTNELYVGVW